ncbi:uncharacterized protein LOC117169990 [Belonocnema kinseyi]|uniref:uncharacterized protein LOC117169990 n=1 Tax=Belonocnema kinseyi TaxID=2817044 RepID=UPI00143DA17E|nr:uncharacterized protein LOC117169990 [Belonocnema kinseyi]
MSAIHRKEFYEEIQGLSKSENLPKTSKLLRLHPFIEDHLLRVGGRIKNAEIDKDQKHPILLPRNHPVTNFIILDIHERQFHSGVNGTLYATRLKKCFRGRPKELDYVMGNLPGVKEKRPRNRNKVKVNAAVFVCLSTKAVYIELVGDLTTDIFIASLRRVFARRGKAKAIYSDNGANFFGAKNKLNVLYSFLNSDEHNKKVESYLIDQGIERHFSPPRTPHFGGIWEAVVKSLKHNMLKTIGHSHPCHQIPAICQQIQKLKGDFWKCWNCEYLNEMNVRSKWHTGSADLIRIGSLVVLKDENLPPLRWKLGRIIEVHPGDDGIIRVATLKSKSDVFERGVKKISPIPAELRPCNVIQMSVFLIEAPTARLVHRLDAKKISKVGRCMRLFRKKKPAK